MYKLQDKVVVETKEIEIPEHYHQLNIFPVGEVPGTIPVVDPQYSG